MGPVLGFDGSAASILNVLLVGLIVCVVPLFVCFPPLQYYSWEQYIITEGHASANCSIERKETDKCEFNWLQRCVPMSSHLVR